MLWPIVDLELLSHMKRERNMNGVHPPSCASRTCLRVELEDFLARCISKTWVYQGSSEASFSGTFLEKKMSGPKDAFLYLLICPCKWNQIFVGWGVELGQIGQKNIHGLPSTASL